MKRTTALLAAIAFFTVCFAVKADYSVSNEGRWPKSWPKELEPLRKSSQTFVGPIVEEIHYQISFTKREDFESAWPHILKVKSKGVPLRLLRSPHTWLDTVKAGVRIHCPPAEKDQQVNPKMIDLIVDGKIVDLNRIPLPADTPIIDERFKDEQKKLLNRSGD
jgi:hypothetical protein